MQSGLWMLKICKRSKKKSLNNLNIIRDLGIDDKEKVGV